MTSNITKLCGFDRKVPDMYVGMYGFDAGRKVYKGEEYTSSYAPEHSDGSTLMPPLMKAVALFTGADKSRKWALGKATDGSYICELTSKSRPEILSVATWNPESGRMRGVSYDYTSGQTLKYVIDKKSKASPSKAHVTDSTALMLCMMQEIGTDSEAAGLLSAAGKGFAGEMMSSVLQMNIAKLCDNVYRRIMSDKLLVDLGDKGEPDPMNMAEIKNSAIRIKETFFGAFEQVGAGDMSEAIEIAEGEYDLGISLTDAQKKYLPHVPSGHVVTRTEKRILDLIKRSRELGRGAVKNILLEGPPGTGKSQMAMDIAHQLGLPYYLQGCSDGTNEDSLLEYFVPSASGAPVGGSLLELLRRIPSEAEMALAPEAAYKKFTGKTFPGATTEDVTSVIYDAVQAAVGESGVRYECKESLLLKGLRSGGVVELAEPGAIVSPTVLTILNDVLNSSDGIVETPRGVVKRHPDCYIIATTNPDNYGGYRKLNEAVRDRFQRVFSVGAPSKDEMIDRVIAQGYLTDDSLVEILVRAISVLEATITEKGIQGHVGMRSLFEWAKDISFGDSVIESMMSCVINGITTNEEEQSLLISALHDNTEIYDLK